MGRLCNADVQVRLLNTLHYRIPYSVKVMADEAKVLYPFVTTLQVVLRTYTESCHSIEPSPASAFSGGGGGKSTGMYTKKGDSIIALLVAAYQREAQQRLAEGMTLRWDSDRLEAYVRKVADVMYIFEGKVELALMQHATALKDIEAIRGVPLDVERANLLEVRLSRGRSDSNEPQIHTCLAIAYSSPVYILAHGHHVRCRCLHADPQRYTG